MMASTVVVRMRTCSRNTKVTAEMQDDGDTIRITIASDCKNVMNYADLLGGEVHVSDVVEWKGSRVVDPDTRQPLSIPCLVPNAVFDAAWMEIGMLSKNLAQGMAKENSLEFPEDERCRSEGGFGGVRNPLPAAGVVSQSLQSSKSMICQRINGTAN